MNKKNSTASKSTSKDACQDRVDRLTTELRSQSTELERLHAIYDELDTRNALLRNEVLRLKRAQRTNVQDLAHVAAALVHVSKVKGVALDPTTAGILRRRGWLPSKNRTGALRA
ncbi:hypothetical protein [Paenarthrobacter ureafaciens]|uniref:hypothetical protein n=1 Tax=Paenarthrobacter ureafaciens TaxID=37931 RepID=UPI00140D2076|nr:hypothetical protein [Paenarthrobacter ureafaciens]MCX8453709.1 hypothetical protein [Paenarthrobacter ureafaciens]MCY0973368.1 hypothetical protein [Paenarthrobacter ureafaciens]